MLLLWGPHSGNFCAERKKTHLCEEAKVGETLVSFTCACPDVWLLLECEPRKAFLEDSTYPSLKNTTTTTNNNENNIVINSRSFFCFLV